MKLYNVLIKKNKEGKISDILVIKEGFSFFAFLFSALWFFYHKMWKEFFALIIADIAFNLCAELMPGFDKVLLHIFFFFIIALNANYWFCEHLKSKGYEFAGLIFGKDVNEARLRFMKDVAADEYDNLLLLNPAL